jgi:glycosyltransferase involved in cell wall biosynthesis
MMQLHAYFAELTTILRDRPHEFGDAPPSALLEQIEGLCPVPVTPARPRAAGNHLNIAVICREYPPETAHGGMATFSRHLAHGLAELGHRVVVISQGTPVASRDGHGSIDVLRIQPHLSGMASFEEHCRRGRLTFAKNVFGYSLGLYRQLLDIEKQWGAFDVLDLPDHAAEGLIPTLFWKGPKTVRLYSPWSVLHEMRANFYAEDDFEELRILEEAALRRAEVVTSPSRDLAARTRTFFGLPNDIPFVPNPLDTEAFHPATRTDGPVRFGFAGRLEVRKGITTLFEAIPRVLAENADVRFRIMGKDVSSFRALYQPLLDAERVEFLDPVPLTELPKFYQSVDVAVVPSHYDNSPYTCMEPMACGLPVIGTRAGGMPEYIAHGETGVILPMQNSAALAAAILRLAGDEASRTRMGAAARARMVSRYDYRAVARLMVEHYRDAIAIRRGHELCAVAKPVRLPEPPPEAPSNLRGEVVVVANDGEERLVDVTLSSLRGNGTTLQSIVILWQGRKAPSSFHGCRVFHDPATPAATLAARIFSTVLADFFVCLRAGDLLDRTALAKAAWKFAAFENIGVVVDRPISRNGGDWHSHPFFRAAAVRGSAYVVADEPSSWPATMQCVYDQVHAAGWRDAVVDDVLVRSSNQGDLTCRPSENTHRLPLLARPAPEEGMTRPAPAVAGPRKGPRWLHRLVLQGLYAVSGRRLQPLRSKIRAILTSSRFTHPLAGWLSRTKGSLGTGGFFALDDERLAVVILTRRLDDGVRLWHALRGRTEIAVENPQPAIVVTEHTTASANDLDIDVYHLPRLVPDAHRSFAVAHLLQKQRRSRLFVAEDHGDDRLLAALADRYRPEWAAAPRS